MKQVKHVSVAEVQTWLAKDAQSLVLIDVREPAEYRTVCIKQAQLIPLGEITSDKLPTKKKKIVLQCRLGGRSQKAAEKLLAEDASLDVYSVDGGIEAWVQAGYPVKKSGGAVLPLDRQTQITAGFLVFSGTIMGAIVDPWWYVLPGFIGAGLMFAGLSGYCGMARVLARMPWNQ